MSRILPHDHSNLQQGGKIKGASIAGVSLTGPGSGGGGDGTSPEPAATVTDETTWAITPAVGTDAAYARQDHTHGTPTEPSVASAVGPILIIDTPAGSPLVFADLLQNDDGDDLLYSDL